MANLVNSIDTEIISSGSNIEIDLTAKHSVINNLTTASAGNGVLDAYQGKVLDDKINNACNYSTTETIIGEWIDGKPLYRKTFSIGEITSSADTTVSTGILNCDTITQMSGNFKRKSFEYLRYGLDSNYLGEVHFDSNTGVFSIKSGSSSVGFSSGVITMEYTKTTD